MDIKLLRSGRQVGVIVFTHTDVEFEIGFISSIDHPDKKIVTRIKQLLKNPFGNAVIGGETPDDLSTTLDGVYVALGNLTRELSSFTFACRRKAKVHYPAGAIG